MYLQLADDLRLGDGHQLRVLDGEGGVGDDGQEAGVHLLGGGGPGQHGAQDGLEAEERWRRRGGEVEEKRRGGGEEEER